jgi:hypothetical protein
MKPRDRLSTISPRVAEFEIFDLEAQSALHDVSAPDQQFLRSARSWGSSSAWQIVFLTASLMRTFAFSAFASVDSSPTKPGVAPCAIALRYAYIFDQTLSCDSPEKAE